jgi:hypothetical protein
MIFASSSQGFFGPSVLVVDSGGDEDGCTSLLPNYETAAEIYVLGFPLIPILPIKLQLDSEGGLR